jgi:glycine/D-amino acid oxidase-like deaminating enzyme/nitrite reductase/ring-hydroxylating ferredoxin subunit
MNPQEIVPHHPQSLWLATTPSTAYPRLDRDLDVDVAILGGGLCGLNTAMLLRQEGFSVAVLEARRIAAAVTGHTTAKITALHGLIYRQLSANFGIDTARLYAGANQSAIERYARIIVEGGIECDFRRQPAFTYTTSDDDLDDLLEEVEAAEQVGLPSSFTASLPLPFPIRGAIRLDDQALFHPRKYLLAVAEQLTAAGGLIFEESRVRQIDTDRPEVTVEGARVRAKQLVICTHFPVQDPTFFFTRMFPRHSYVLAAKLDAAVPEGMYYSTSDPYCSLRPHFMGDQEFLLVGGQNHKTGHATSTLEHYRNLEIFVRRHFPVKEISYRWSTQDYTTADRIPFIGHLSPGAKKSYVATGFGGWGMAHAMVAAEIITDQIMGRDNPWSSLYDPSRIHLRGVSSFLKENLDAAKTLVKERLVSHEALAPEQLQAGQGGVYEDRHNRIAVARDGDGGLHAVSSLCTHMGCVVTWNDGDATWDCPCHGSRFAIDGEVLDGPAQTSLEKRTIQ